MTAKNCTQLDKEITDLRRESDRQDASLREIFDAKIDAIMQGVQARRQAVDDRFGALQLAVNKSEEAMNHRLEGMNEFRDALKDAQQHFTTRAEHQALMDKYDTAMADLKDALAKTATFAEVSLVRDRLATFLTRDEWIAKGRDNRAVFFAVAALLISAITLAIGLSEILAK